MPKTRAQKEATVKNLSDKLARAKALVFADYRGLTMKQLSDLRNKLIDQRAEFSITKNSLLKRALPASLSRAQSRGSFQLPTSNFSGPTATLFAYDDEISPLKILVKVLKDAGVGKVKMGFLGKETLDEVKILELATLPSKDELKAKTVGVLAAPLQGILEVLQGNLRNLVYTIDQIQIQRGGDRSN